MAIYPVLGSLFGHTYPRAPMFGVAPCPATIFTFGMLLWATKPVPAYLLAIPLLWALIGLNAAISLRVPQDYGLAVAGVFGTVLVLVQNRECMVRELNEHNAAVLAGSMRTDRNRNMHA
jgi:hypothetical protein